MVNRTENLSKSSDEQYAMLTPQVNAEGEIEVSYEVLESVKQLQREAVQIYYDQTHPFHKHITSLVYLNTVRTRNSHEYSDLAAKINIPRNTLLFSIFLFISLASSEAFQSPHLITIIQSWWVLFSSSAVITVSRWDERGFQDKDVRHLEQQINEISTSYQDLANLLTSELSMPVTAHQLKKLVH